MAKPKRGYYGNKLHLKERCQSDPWGPCCVHNPKRVTRPAGGDHAQCNLCSRGPDCNYFQFDGLDYVALRNKWPITADQLLVVSRRHREEFVLTDILLMLDMIHNGFDNRTIRYRPGEALIFVNPSANSGRSQPHFHFHATRSADVHWPACSIAPWPLCGSVDLGWLHLVDGLPYCAFQVAGHDATIAEFAERLGVFFAYEGIPYNLVVRANRASSTLSFIIIPRKAEYSKTVDQKVGALELASAGVFLPGPKVDPRKMTVGMRDQALAETTYASPDDCVHLLDGLRKKFGARYEGKTVVAIRHSTNV